MEFPGPPRVSHPITCRYFAVDLAEIDAREAIAMARWSKLELLLAFREMCKGVQRLHRKGIVHRDLKPENFLVDGDSVLVADLGTATEVEPNWNPLFGAYITFYPGDRRYRAPETKFGLCDEDPRTLYKADIFSLGAILFEMCTNAQFLPTLGPQVIEAMESAMTGRKPGRHIQQFNDHIGAITADFPLPKITEFGSGIPGSISKRLDQLYSRMASLDYRQRPSNFDDVFRQLNICTMILQYEIKHRRRREMRQRRRELREQ